MKRLLAALIATSFLLNCRYVPAEPAVTVENAVVTVPAVPGGPGAGYFTITTNNDPTSLISVTSPSVRSIELHETREEGGRTEMRELAPGNTTFHPGKPLRFAPGGKHAMLMGVDPAIRPGGKIRLVFDIQPIREPVIVEAEVRGPGQVHAEH